MNRRTTSLSAFSAIAVAAALTLTGCSSDSGSDAPAKADAGKPQLKVSGAFMPQPVMDMAGGFLTITNTGDTADKLTSVTSVISDDVSLHETKNQKMQPVKSFDVPANGELKLERGGNHIMFMQLKQKPKQGEKVAIELHFEKSDAIKVDLPVEAPNHNPKQH
ncbi:copper metallochaperone, bacterial analog of cox17 protein [Streptomyces laurentii]|uniref:Copper metallochaperone, bacterial analog of cox17 protein n=1 Tax=Streptomyces laurentii TaxID=39478 RepID=A0A160P045_STRLU|nr:copper metallochaperone, bacterial analog of cox17 protein [Streptomyces laurentii]